MATYKVIQDIEADDKLLGPLSLKQFIYVAITVTCLYLTFFAAQRGGAFIGVFLIPVGAFFGVLGFPWSKSQPTEVWLLAKVRFWFKPRRRIWDQSGVKELVSVTVPKKIERRYTDGLDQSQVRNRLTALAQTVDSRGWAVKQLPAAPFAQATTSSDRLTSGTETKQTAVVSDVRIEEDVLDERNNPTAQKIDKMITESTKTHRDQLRTQLSQQAHPQPQQNGSTNTNQTQPADYWFMNQNDPSATPSGMTTGQSRTVTPHSEHIPTNNGQVISKQDEAALLDKIHSSQARKPSRNSHLKTVLPLSEQTKKNAKQHDLSTPTTKTEVKAPEPPSKPTPDPAILGLANNDDLNVETIARQANKRNEEPPDEVVISLH